MIKHWYWQENGVVLEGDGDNEVLADQPDMWYFIDVKGEDSEGAVHEDQLYKTREEAVQVAIVWLDNQINALEDQRRELHQEQWKLEGIE